MDFEVIVDSSLLGAIGPSHSLSPINNKSLLSLVNDYEDGLWREEKFRSFVWDNIAYTALTQSERTALEGRPSSSLREAAKNLRFTESDNDIGKGSELAEVVLYGIMQHHYQALPVVPKIFYKQNTQDNAKGADSVHIVLEDDGKFSLWFGEAKFYNSIEDTRLNSIVQSVKRSLRTDKLKKENRIITNLSDINELGIPDSLIDKIKSTLSNANSIDSIKPILHIPILLIHECQITCSANAIDSSYRSDIRSYHKERAISYFSKQIEALKGVHLYDQIKFHLILFPVPKKETLVNKFEEEVAFYKG